MSFSNSRGKFFCLVFLSVFLLASKANLTQITAPSIQDLLRNRIEAGGVGAKIQIDQELIYSSIVLPVFYEKRVYWPAWTDMDADFHNAVSLLKIIRKIDREGLRPMDYHLEKIETILSEVQGLQKRQAPRNPNKLVDIDLSLTDAFLILGSHLFSGKINSQTPSTLSGMSTVANAIWPSCSKPLWLRIKSKPRCIPCFPAIKDMHACARLWPTTGKLLKKADGLLFQRDLNCKKVTTAIEFRF